MSRKRKTFTADFKAKCVLDKIVTGIDGKLNFIQLLECKKKPYSLVS